MFGIFTPKGHNLNNDLNNYAAYNGSLDCLKYLLHNGIPLKISALYWIAFYGHYNCLVFAHQNKYTLHDKTCTLAAEGGHLNCLTYAHENGYHWDEDTCSSAARRGSPRLFIICAPKWLSVG